MDDQLTVVMLNWKRPDNVRRFAKFYATHDCVARVLVANCNPITSLRFFGGLPNVHAVHFEHDPGLPARFALAALARTNLVMFVDDDIDLPDETVRVLHREYRRTNAGVVGIFGRRATTGPDGRPAYNTQTVHGPCDVVLTRACVTTRDLACRAADAVHRMAAEVPGGEPYGNGEDIVLSYVTMDTNSRRPNLAYHLPYRNVGYDDEHAISVRFKGHEQYRTQVLRWCRARHGR